MSQLRKDPVTGRWVIVNVETPRTQFPVKKQILSSKTCPFCPGNESMTPPQIASYGPIRGGAPRVQSGWQVRVIPNKFPALRIEESTEKKGVGIYDRIGGYGAHEVIIDNPSHSREIADLAVEEVELILKVYRDRCLDLKKDPRLRYILIFKNYGQQAGASQEHPHSQLIALPIIPSRVLGQVQGAANHFALTERCIYCDMLDQEKIEKKLTVASDGDFIAMTPFASRTPFETWILPTRHKPSYDMITDSEITSLAKVFCVTMRKIKDLLGDPQYNFMIHTVPMAVREGEHYHWHIEIIPYLTEVAGFELGTGFYVNPTPPEVAADCLRRVPERKHE